MTKCKSTLSWSRCRRPFFFHPPPLLFSSSPTTTAPLRANRPPGCPRALFPEFLPSVSHVLPIFSFFAPNPPRRLVAARKHRPSDPLWHRVESKHPPTRSCSVPDPRRRHQAAENTSFSPLKSSPITLQTRLSASKSSFVSPSPLDESTPLQQIHLCRPGISPETTDTLRKKEEASRPSDKNVRQLFRIHPASRLRAVL